MGQKISSDEIKYKINLSELIEKIYKKKDLTKYKNYKIYTNFDINDIESILLFDEIKSYKNFKFKNLEYIIKFYHKNEFKLFECRFEKKDLEYLYNHRNNFINHKIYLI